MLTCNFWDFFKENIFKFVSQKKMSEKHTPQKTLIFGDQNKTISQNYSNGKIYVGEKFYNNSSQGNGIENIKNWENLILLFSETQGQWFINNIKTSSSYELTNLNLIGYKKCISDRFKAIHVDIEDPKAKILYRIEEKAKDSLKRFRESKDETQFHEDWKKYREELNLIYSTL